MLLKKKNKKGCLCEKQPLYEIRFELLFGKTLHQRRLQVRSLVGVDVVALGQLINHCNDQWKPFGSLGWAFLTAQVANGVAGGLGIITIKKPALGNLTNTLFG